MQALREKCLATNTLQYTSKNRTTQGWIQDLKCGVDFCNNVREIKYYFKIKRRGLRKRGEKIHPFHIPWICTCNILYQISVHQICMLSLRISEWIWAVSHIQLSWLVSRQIITLVWSIESQLFILFPSRQISPKRNTLQDRLIDVILCLKVQGLRTSDHISFSYHRWHSPPIHCCVYRARKKTRPVVWDK